MFELSKAVFPIREKPDHAQALLADDELSDGSLSILAHETETRYQRRAVSWVALASVILSMFSILVVGSGLFSHGLTKTASQSPVYQNDYILSDTWDYLAPSQRREFDWVLEETEFNPDGVFRPMLLINKEFPGPLIEVNEGDTVKVTVHNHMTNATSLHWHGIYQNGTNFMDGTVGVTQCPIAPGTTFVYEFTVSGQSGTYWYHAHQAAQASDGLVGPLIIHSKHERAVQPLQYASDRIIMLSDHYHHLSSRLARKYLAPDMENTEPVPDSALINGRASRNCDDMPQRKCDNSTVVRPSFHMQANEMHRLRIINTGAFAEFQFQIDEHELAVIEADGTDLQAAYYHRLNISPAQRYSVIVHTNQTHRDSFQMRARMVDGCFAGLNDFGTNEVNAVVVYKSSAQATTTMPDSKDWNEQLDTECHDINATELIPIPAIAAPAKEDAFFYLRTNFRIGDYRLSRGYFNESTWKPNTTSPTLFQFLDHTSPASSTVHIDANQDTSITTSSSSNQFTIQTTGIQTIDLLIHNTDDGAHPMHLHGHKFFILAQGQGYPPRTSLLEGVSRPTVQPLYENLDLTNPLRRDTATVPAYGWVLLRFVADNPGAWAFHCHVGWHAEAGLAMQFLTRSNEIGRTLENDETALERVRELCRADPEELGKGTAPSDEEYVQEALDGSERNGTGCEGESVRGCAYDDLDK